MTLGALLLGAMTLSSVLAGAASDVSCPSVPLLETPVAIFTEHLRQVFFDLNPSNTFTSVRLINYRAVAERIAFYFEVASADGSKYFKGFLAKYLVEEQDLKIVKLIQSEDFGDLVRFFGDTKTKATDSINCVYLKEFFYISIFNNNFITPLFQQNVDILVNKDLFELVQASLQGLEASKTREQRNRASKVDNSIKTVAFSGGSDSSAWPNFPAGPGPNGGGKPAAPVQGSGGTVGGAGTGEAAGFQAVKNPHLANNPMTMGDSVRAKLARENPGLYADVAQTPQYFSDITPSGGSGSGQGSAAPAGSQFSAGKKSFVGGNFMIGHSLKGDDVGNGGSSGAQAPKAKKAAAVVEAKAEVSSADLPKIVVKDPPKEKKDQKPAAEADKLKIRPTEWSVSNPEFYKKYSIVREKATRRLGKEKGPARAAAGNPPRKTKP